MKKSWFISGILGFVAAVLYFASTADYAFPGESAKLISTWKGLELAAKPLYPFMALFAKLLGGDNLLAPICGVIAVVVFYHLVRLFISVRMGEETAEGEKKNIADIAAVVATLVFMLTPAVRSAATHLEPRMFDFTWMLLTFALSIPFFRGAFGFSWLFPLLLGVTSALGFMDSVLFLVFLPFYVTLIVVVSLRNDRKPYVPLFLFLFAGFLTIVLASRAFDMNLSEVLRRSADEFRAYYSTPGWLFVLIFTTIPFVTALFSTKNSFGEKPSFVQWIFHSAMAFVAILAVATPLSPSSLMEPYGQFPVVTSAFAAAVAGYLIAYWWLYRRMTVSLVVGSILGFVLVVTLIWNLFTFDGKAGAFADKVARKIIDDLDGRRWLVTDGTIDSHLKIVAAEMDKDINLICLARDLDEAYLTELSEIVKREGIGGSKNGALQLSLSLGVLPFVQDWFSSDPSVIKDVAIFGAPDLWYSAGLTPVPEFFFFGADDKREPDWSVWPSFNAILEVPKGWGSYRDRKVSNPVDRLRFSLRRHLGFVANNRGVYLQDNKKNDEAFKMYELVLNEIDRDNICAIFNEVAMVGQKHPGALTKQRDLERMLKVAVDDKNRRYLLWRLGTYYGYIRNPDTFIRLGHAWARSGRPGDALSQIRRAIDFVPSDKRAVLLNMMAALYANENDQSQSRKLYLSVLEKDKADHDALIGMMRLELLEGNSAKALDYLQRAASASKDDKSMNLELAMVAMMKNDYAEAKKLIKKVTDADAKNMQAWSLLAAVTMQQIDMTKDEKTKKALTKELEDVTIPAMEKQARDQFDYYLQSTKGFVQLRRGAEGRQKAREAFLAAARARPDIATTHDMVLGLDISLDDKEGAEQHAKEVLRRNRKAPLANYVMGSLALGQGKYAEAEAYLRIAADAPQPVPLALNDMAEVLRRQKNYAEAERYARKAVERAPTLYVAWETLGAVLMDANRNLDEAEAAIRKACTLSKDKDGKEADVRMLISLARIQLKNGDREHAKVTIRKVQARLKELSEFERAEFDQILKKVR